MASAAKQLFSNLSSHHRSHHTSTFRRSSTKSDVTKHEDTEVFNKRKEEEKHFIASWEEGSQTHVLAPSEIVKDPSQKRVGQSSKHLKCEDFKLLTTLGTGADILLVSKMLHALIGNPVQALSRVYG